MHIYICIYIERPKLIYANIYKHIYMHSTNYGLFYGLMTLRHYVIFARVSEPYWFPYADWLYKDQASLLFMFLLILIGRLFTASFITLFLRIYRIVFTIRIRSRMSKANYGKLTASTAVFRQILTQS